MIYRDGKPCPDPIKIEHGVPIPERAPTEASVIADAARAMKVGDSIVVPYSRNSFVSLMTKTTGFKFTQRKESKMLRIWRIK